MVKPRDCHVRSIRYRSLWNRGSVSLPDADQLMIRSGDMSLREQLLKNGFSLRPVAVP
ncbi:MAG: hypothetical protein ACI4UV_01885 [Victivallales bacterium]